jgi:hypothetical protein
MEPHEQQPDRFIPPNAWPDFHPWPTLGGLRYLIAHENTNGFNEVITRIGRRILISERAFRAWVAKHGPHLPPTSKRAGGRK